MVSIKIKKEDKAWKAYEECPVVFHFDLILACHVFILKCYEYCIFFDKC